MPADSEECTIHIEDLNVNVDRWNNYTFFSDFLTPADNFVFEVGDPDFPDDVSRRLAPGMKVRILLDDRTVCTGHIDEVAAGADRGSGTLFRISGRDVLGDVIDSSIDPYMNFTPEQSLIDVATKVLTPFGLTVISSDNDAERSIRSANKFGEKKNYKKGKQKETITHTAKAWNAQTGKVENKTTVLQGPKQPKQYVQYKAVMFDAVKNKPYIGTVVLEKPKGGSLSSAQQHQTKPYPHEGAYEFLSRIAKREGLHIWAKADGTGVVIGKPFFSQQPIYRLIRRRGPGRGSENNIISGSVKHARTEQPSVIIAGGRGGGGDFPRATIRCAMVNELVGLGLDGEPVPGVKEVLKRFPKAYQITEADFEDGSAPSARNPYPRARPMFIMDQESNNLKQLINFTKREMASRQMQALQCVYVVAGHTQDGRSWAVDTTVEVDDDVANLHETMWVKSIEYHKSRSGGTTTTLTLIRPNTLRL